MAVEVVHTLHVSAQEKRDTHTQYSVLTCYSRRRGGIWGKNRKVHKTSKGRKHLSRTNISIAAREFQVRERALVTAGSIGVDGVIAGSRSETVRIPSPELLFVIIVCG